MSVSSPLAEVDLCGHATIGSFWLLAELGIIQAQEGEVRVHQVTKAGDSRSISN